MTVWEPEVGEEVVVIGGAYREEARTRKVERLTKTTIVVENEGTRFRREPSDYGGDTCYRGKGGDAWVTPPNLFDPASFRARKVLAETEERDARIAMRRSAERLEKDPRLPGGVYQLQEGIKRLERAVAAMNAIHEERPESRPRKVGYR